MRRTILISISILFLALLVPAIFLVNYLKLDVENIIFHNNSYRGSDLLQRKMNFISRMCATYRTPIERGTKIRCDMKDLGEGEWVHPQICYDRKLTFLPDGLLNGYKTLNIKKLNDDYLVDRFMEEDIRTINCASFFKDQVAYLYGMLLSLSYHNKSGMWCIPQLNEWASLKMDGKFCYPESVYTQINFDEINSFDEVWEGFVKSLPIADIENIEPSEIPKQCNKVGYINSVWNPCGIAEIWLLRYKTLELQGRQNSKEALVAKSIFEFETDLSINNPFEPQAGEGQNFPH